MKRETRIDIVRGLAMLTILINHFAMAYRAVGYHGWELPTPTQLGYSSAASIFVALSGYMVGMVYLRRPHPVQAVLRRACQLYLINAAIFLLVWPAALFANPARDRFWNMHILAENPPEGVLRFLTLRDAPAFLDVLQLYVVLLLMTPLAIWLVRRSPWLLLAASVALWALIQLWPFHLPGDVPTIGRSLNPLAWQMAFFLPMIAGMHHWHEPVLAFFQRHHLVAVALFLLLVAFAWADETDLRLTRPGIHMALTSRFHHGPVWTVHAATLLAFYLALLTWLRPWLTALPFRLLASMGRNSLYVYAASIPIIFALAIGIGALRIDATCYVLGTILTVLLCQAVASLSDRRKAREKARHADAPKNPLPTLK